jgi:hypothetical protein
MPQEIIDLLMALLINTSDNSSKIKSRCSGQVLLGEGGKEDKTAGLLV